jgi:peptidoglycan/LPS O-acetylase OafA/YrhL
MSVEIKAPDDWRMFTNQRPPMRFRFLDALRGWAAVVVLFHHIFVDPRGGFSEKAGLQAQKFR